MFYTLRLAKRGLAVLPAFLLAILVLAGTVTSAYAKQCDIDPTAVLSDGTHVKMKTSVDTDSTNVSAAHYLVHGPVGTTLDNVVYSGPHQVPDTVDFVADNADGVYTVDTVVDASVSATVETTVQIRSNHTTTIGVTNVTLTSTVTP